jgi:predicted phosphatase
MILCIDFDGTLCEHRFPEIGEPYLWLIEKLKIRRINGDKLILWTCRDGKFLDEAVKWCKEFGLVFDAVNDDLPEIKKSFIYKSKKVYGDVYLDDRNISFENI